MAEHAAYTRFACIGAGFSGIGLGVQLKRWYNQDDICFFERHGELGGTWWISKYPGCACDVPSALYSYSFEPNPGWSRLLADSSELHRYLRNVADKYGLINKMTFRADVKRCEWIEERARWRLTVLDLETRTEFFHECQFLFSGAGLLVNPRGFDVPGAESFSGPIIHSARWDNDVDLAGKRVVLFGNGCTAVQIVPNILGKTKHLTQIIRSKHWILPSFDRAIGPVAQWMLRYVPGANFVLRLAVYLFTESEAKAFSMTESGRRFRERWQKVSETYIRETAPAKYHDLLIPDFEIGCKRRIFDSGYVESLHSENLTLTDDKVVQILPDGVRTERGFVEADVIVLANGFETNHFLSGVELVGRGGKTATEHWDEFGGPEAYNTTALSGFPNFFMMYGPNSGTGHTSTIINIENAINFALRVIKPVIDGQASIVNVKRGAEEWYSDRVQQKSRDTVWYSGCVSWYFKTTKNGQKWNSMINPLSQVQFWFQSLFPTWAHWEYSVRHWAPKELILGDD
ncbi:hypothetical protein NW759_013615 [Fusarium solani]|nr:hypothetical protein NW759_013615 [Fusarium solani]